MLALPLVATAAAAAQQWANPAKRATIQDQPAYQTSVQPYRSHSITLNQQGAIQGHIASIDAQTTSKTGLSGMNVYFIRDGQIAYQARTSNDGDFMIPGVAQGPYSFVASGPTGFAAYGVFVLANDGQNDINIMEAAAVSPQVSGIRQILNANLPTQVTDQIMQAASLNSAQPTEVTGASKVRLVDGQLNGQIVSLFGQGERVRGTIVNLVQDGRRVAEVQVDEQGNYTIPDLQPGVYDFVAVGYNGLAALRFEAVGQDSPMTQVAFGTTPILISTTLDACLTCQQDNQVIDQSIDYAVQGDSVIDDSMMPMEYAGESIGTGTAMGGSCGCEGSTMYGGGGRFRGGFRGGHGGRLLLFGAAATGITALATDPSPASPNN